MFVDFDKVFAEKRQTGLPIPKALVDHLSDRLPKGLRYAVHEQCLHVVPEDGADLRFSGFHFAPTVEQKACLGDNYSEEDILAFSHNAQQKIPLELNNEGILIVNGERLPMNALIQSPYNPVSFAEGSLYVFPQEFDPPFYLSVGSDKYSRLLLIKRIPHNSIHTQAFESDESSPLLISYQLNTKEQKMTMSISFNLDAAHSIRDYVETIAIYNAFIEGKGYIGGHLFPSKLVGEQVKKYDEDSLSFWEKVMQVERILGVNFIPPREDVSFDTICDVEQLYQNLVNQTPIRDTNKIETISGTWTIERQQDIQESIGRSMLFEFEATTTLTLFGVSISLPCFLMVFNSRLTGVVEEGDTYRIQLDDDSEAQPRFTSMLCFKDNDSMRTYKAGDRNDMLTKFREAKRARQYIIP